MAVERRRRDSRAAGDIAQGGTVDAPIGRHPTRRTTMAVVATGKPARTDSIPCGKESSRNGEPMAGFAAARRASSAISLVGKVA